MVGISACHAGDPGSIPGGGVCLPGQPHPSAQAGLLRRSPFAAVPQQTSSVMTPETSLHFIKPAIAQLAEHLTVESRSYQMVPGSIPGGRTFVDNFASGQCSADSTSILAWPFSFSQPALVPASRRQPSKCSHLPMLTNIDAFLAIGLLSSVGRACAS